MAFGMPNVVRAWQQGATRPAKPTPKSARPFGMPGHGNPAPARPAVSQPAAPAATPSRPAAPMPYTINSATRPPDPDTGGHYTRVGQNRWQLIHATGPNQWAPGPPPKYSQSLFQPTQVQRGRNLDIAAHQLTNLTYDPLISQLSTQIATNAAQGAAAQKQTAEYFNQLLPYAQQSAQDVQNIGQGLTTQLQQIGQGTQTALDKIGQQAVSPALQSLANQGLGGGATEQLAAQIAGLKGTALDQAAIDQAYGAKIGSSAASLAASLPGTYALRGQERLGQIAQATRLAQQPVEEKLASTRAEKVNAYGTNLQAIRQQAFNNWVAQQGLQNTAAGIQAGVTKTAMTQAGEAARAAAAQAGQTKRTQMNIDARATQGKLDRASREGIAAANRTARKAIADGKTAAKSGKPASPAAQRVMWNKITGIQGRLRWLVANIGSWTGATPQSARSQAWHALNTGRLFAPYKDKDGKQKWHWVQIPTEGDTGLLNVAFNSLFNDGGLNTGDVAYLHNMGFTIGNLMPIKPPDQSVSGGVGFGHTY